MRAFIIRPFGIKENINFNLVEQQLIEPALNSLKIYGRTTVEITRAGNIREDMFSRLLTADLVIADLSVHNPNVFYELGIRHAFRDKFTFLIRSNASPVPFDLLTDRYLEYDHEHPELSVSALTQALQQTINSEQSDSPVFQYLPHLKPEETALFLTLPREFREAVARAKHNKLRGDLRLLAQEAVGFVWETAGMRAVGRAQFEINSLNGARKTWEKIQRAYPEDPEANLTLLKIYQRLGDSAASEAALHRVFKLADLTPAQLAEALNLRGLYEQSEWLKDWKKGDREKWRQQALRSPWLRNALETYLKALRCDLNYYEAGINALALLTIQLSLAEELSSLWTALYGGDEGDEEDELRQMLAERKKKQMMKLRNQLLATLEFALEARRNRLKSVSADTHDYWFEIADAAFNCLTSKRSPEKIELEFAEALALAPSYADYAMHQFLTMFEELQVLPDNVAAARRAFRASTLADTGKTVGLKAKRILLFAGHTLDERGTSTPRFPASACAAAKEKIKEIIEQEKAQSDEIVFGMAGGAAGGDLLFHEACEEAKIPTKLFLPTAVDHFVGFYVSNSGSEWIEKFWKRYNLLKLKSVHILDEQDMPEELPRWLQEKSVSYNVRRRNNLWLLNHALALNSAITLIVLWDGQPSKNPGDIAELVELAKEHGIKPEYIYTNELCQTVRPV